MSDGSAIQWTDSTLNIVTGCTRVSEGCDNCYIARTPPFRMAGRTFDKPGIGGATGVLLYPDRVGAPLTWRTPRRVFVNSLADLFHEDVPDSLIAELWSVMARTPQHIYQILTKRPARMRSLLSRASFRDNLAQWDQPWPLPNAHLGVSVENQYWSDLRIPLLAQTPAAVRFLSCEPLLGPIDLGVDHADHESDYDGDRFCLDCSTEYVRIPWRVRDIDAPIGWVIVGGESGKGARPMDLEWARSLVAQCRAADIPVFVKQLGRDWAKGSAAVDRAHGGDPAEWPEDLRVREYPIAAAAVAAR